MDVQGLHNTWSMIQQVFWLPEKKRGKVKINVERANNMEDLRIKNTKFECVKLVYFKETTHCALVHFYSTVL